MRSEEEVETELRKVNRIIESFDRYDGDRNRAWMNGQRSALEWFLNEPEGEE